MKEDSRIAEGKIAMQVMEWAWKNNTISNKFCSCEGFKMKKQNPDLKLAMTDGGWVNCIKLHDFLRREVL